jgi:transcription initiation factor TFIID TATA-box-binding protein
MGKPTCRVENIVATIDLGTSLDLEGLAGVLPGADYDANRFPGLVLRLRNPKVAFLLFKNGKVVCTGSKSMGQVSEGVGALISMLRSRGVGVPVVPTPRVENIVATCDLHAMVNVEKAVFLLGNAFYDPEVFPGLVYAGFGVTFLVFYSGRVIVTGARGEGQVMEVAGRLFDLLRGLGVLYVPEFGADEVEGEGGIVKA